VPVPLPASYVEGIDLQTFEFERGLPSYLFGHWRRRGWWQYYIVCALMKEPLGTWALGFLAVAAGLASRISGRDVRKNGAACGAGGARSGADWLDTAALLVPAVVLGVFVSSQTGFSRHFRYTLPALPFLFIWIGGVARADRRIPRSIGTMVVLALTWTVASSLTIFPHSMSYFNELAGGPLGGHRYLVDSNIDWGQDVLYLKEWCSRHPEATPLHAAFSNSFSEALLGFGGSVQDLDELRSGGRGEPTAPNNPREAALGPGWYAMSIHRIHDSNGRYECFRKLKPAAMAGYSIYVYHVTRGEAKAVGGAFGSAEAPGPDVESRE
jgi:hypothetical protein